MLYINILCIVFISKVINLWAAVSFPSRHMTSGLFFPESIDIIMVHCDQGRHQRKAAVLVPTLGFYNNRGLGWAKKISPSEGL